jgi:uncharacterized protein YndB with AHSA1/START domain
VIVLTPIRKTIVVSWDQARAFRRFTQEIGAWWPLRSHSVGQERSETVVFGEGLGGRIVERVRGGEDCTWGTVTAWDPPRHVAFTWHPGDDRERATLVELTFEPLPKGTRLVLLHSRWEALGTLAPMARRGYPIGWAYVLRLWADRRWSPIVLGLDVLQRLLRPLQRRKALRLEQEARRAAATASGGRLG